MMGRSRATKPTLVQNKYIQAAGLDPKDWLVRIDAPNSLALVHKSTGTSRVIEKGPTGGRR